MKWQTIKELEEKLTASDAEIERLKEYEERYYELVNEVLRIDAQVKKELQRKE